MKNAATVDTFKRRQDIFVWTFIFFIGCMTFYEHLYRALAFGLGHVTALKYCLIIIIIIIIINFVQRFFQGNFYQLPVLKNATQTQGWDGSTRDQHYSWLKSVNADILRLVLHWTVIIMPSWYLQIRLSSWDLLISPAPTARAKKKTYKLRTWPGDSFYASMNQLGHHSRLTTGQINVQ